MSWQDIREHYEERDDDGEPAEVELADCQCWECGRVFQLPADDPDRFCSMECMNAWCDRSQKELADIDARQWAAEQARMVPLTCPECGAAFTDVPERSGECCGLACEERQVARLYADLPPVTGDEIPW